MKVLVTGFTDGKKIQAIKGIRCATGLGLKEAKDVADIVSGGQSVEISVTGREYLALLDEHGVIYLQAEVKIDLHDLVEILSRYPRSMTVGDLVDVLGPTAELEAGS